MNGTLQLPTELVKHVSAILGSQGEAWLDRLPRFVEDLRSEWSIEVKEPYAAGEFNFVAAAIRTNGEPVVLKIAPPYHDGEYLREAEFLRHRDGRGAVALLAQDIERRAILLGQAIPGKNLAEIFTGAELDAIDPAIDVLHSISEPAPKDLINVKTIDDWFAGLRRFEDTVFSADYAVKALDLYQRLTATRPLLYLHGDFHPANVVSAQREEYLAIDPKGVIGHIGYDIAVFLNNFHWWLENDPDVRQKLDAAVLSFSKAFDISPIELRQWAFAQMVLGAWWSFDEMPEHYDNATVAKADVWNV